MIFKWLNESEIMMEGDKIEIFAPTGMGGTCIWKFVYWEKDSKKYQSWKKGLVIPNILWK